MRQRPNTLGFVSLLTLLAALPVAHAADASLARQCRQACHDEIAACVAAGSRLRPCRRSVLGRCRREGVAACRDPASGAPTTTTITLTAGTSTTTTTRPRTITTPTPVAGDGPVTGLHYAPNNNFEPGGNYAPGRVGFNLADVSSAGEVSSLPSGVKALVWLGQCNGADSSFISAVQPSIGDPKVYGFYLMDEPDPTGQWAPAVRQPI